jgi:hypothetical protein
MLGGYTNRDDGFGEFLEHFNDDFPDANDIEGRLRSVMAFIEECGFERDSRVWRKADLFTLFVELDQTLNRQSYPLAPSYVVETLSRFYELVGGGTLEGIEGIYYKAALQASNDRINRVRRGIIIAGKLAGKNDGAILQDLSNDGVV